MARLSRPDFIRTAMVDEIASMLDELGHPPLVERVFPNGWRNADQQGLNNLYDLCTRTFASRSAEFGNIGADGVQS